MNEVDKLYKNAKSDNLWIERYERCNFGHYEEVERFYNSYNEMIKTMMSLNDWSRQTAIEVAKKDCTKGHAEFTPDKQMKLLLFALNKTHKLNMSIVDGSYITMDTLVEGIAKNVNSLWDLLTEEEKNKVREILKCAE